MPVEGLGGPSVHRRPFVPLPPIHSNSTVHSEDATSHQSDTAAHVSPEHLSDEDTKSTESVFLTQVPGSSCPCPPVPRPPDGAALGWLDCCRPLGASTWQVWKSLVGDLLTHGFWSGHLQGQVTGLWHGQHLGSGWDVALTSF